MEKIIINEMGTRYVKLSFLKGEKSRYEENILKHANIPGLAEMSVQELDSNTYFLYPIYSYISLREKLDRDLLNVETFLEFYEQLLKVYEQMQMYLLDGKEICLEPEFIFYNQQERKYIFLLIIGDKKSLSEKYENLFTFFADKCPMEEKKLLGFIFENFVVFENEQFEPVTFLKYVLEYDFKDKIEYSFSEIEDNIIDDVEESDENESEKTKGKSTYLFSLGLVTLSMLFAYLADVEMKYGIVSMAASCLAIGLAVISFIKFCQTGKKSQTA